MFRNQKFFALAVLFFCAVPAFGRDLSQRVGLGYNSEFSAFQSGVDLKTPGISIKYALNQNFAAEVIAGLSTDTKFSSVIGVKVFRNIYKEQALNLYVLAGLAGISSRGNGGVQLLGGFGTEFFLPGLDSLGISFEAGGSIDNSLGQYALRTFAASFLEAGVHFYF